jgi:hypothetical protein
LDKQAIQEQEARMEEEKLTELNEQKQVGSKYSIVIGFWIAPIFPVAFETGC